jgi:hypothetical protein
MLLSSPVSDFRVSYFFWSPYVMENCIDSLDAEGFCFLPVLSTWSGRSDFFDDLSVA